jgi:hypothetical protein
MSCCEKGCYSKGNHQVVLTSNQQPEARIHVHHRHGHTSTHQTRIGCQAKSVL